MSLATVGVQPDDFKALLRVHEELVHVSVEVNRMQPLCERLRDGPPV
ncbi:hypothetical protein QTH87_24610 [Variovorax sp. J22P168]|nr:hypothetical protein [Variovorax sp. J22P168]MDM0015643.1 hypothetical protein [Variovorax sp. J22P168]